MPVIFVHGTSVRMARMLEFSAKVTQGLSGQGHLEEAKPYPYGESAAALRYGGLSIPGIDRSNFEERLAEATGQLPLPNLKSSLILDPLLELRSLEGPPLGPFDVGKELLDARNRELGSKTAEVAAGIEREFGVKGQIMRLIFAAATMARSDIDIMTLQDPLARALTAAVCGQTQRPWSDVELQVDGLLSYSFGQKAGLVTDYLMEKALRVAVHFAQESRAKLTLRLMDFMGDIFHYLANREAIQHGLHAFILSEDSKEGGNRPLRLIGHSLGGIVSMDYCMTFPAAKVHLLATVGSQVGLLAEGDMLWEAHPDPKTEGRDERPRGTLDGQGKRVTPRNIKKWINVYDPNDMLSFRAAPIFSKVLDLPFDNEEPFPDCHSAYWDKEALYKAICSEW